MNRISNNVKTINVDELKIKGAECFSEDYATHDYAWPFLENSEVLFNKEEMQKLFDLMNYIFIIKKDPDYSFRDFLCDLCIGQVDWSAEYDDDFWSTVHTTIYRMAEKLGIDISEEDFDDISEEDC